MSIKEKTGVPVLPWAAMLSLMVFRMIWWDSNETNRIATDLSWGASIILSIVVLRSQRLCFTAKPNHLVTSGIYSIVRHPIYNGFFLVDLTILPRVESFDFLFFITWAALAASVCTTCVMEEKLVLKRFGAEAAQYYARTPRFIFEWLWFRRPATV